MDIIDIYTVNYSASIKKNIQLKLFFVPNVSSRQRRQGSRKPLPPFLFCCFLLLCAGRWQRGATLSVFLMPPDGGMGELYHIWYSLISKRRRQPHGCLRLFFISTVFRSIFCPISEDTAERCRRKSGFFALLALFCRIFLKKAKKFWNRAGNGMPPVPRRLRESLEPNPLSNFRRQQDV